MEMYGNLDGLPEPPVEPVATMGNFDGVHLGHQAILGRLQEEAARMDAPTMVITFHPHPRQFLKPEAPFVPLMSLKEKMRRLWELGVDHAVALPFDHDLAEMSATAFVNEVLWQRLRVRAIHVGWNTTFGHGRQGDFRFLQAEGRRLGFGVGVVDPVRVGGRPVSSSRARHAVADGDMELAARLIGRHHRAVGRVVTGDQRGRELGFPTANLATDGGLLPPFGVYAAWAHAADGGRQGAVVNIGVRPTFSGGAMTVEAHLLDFSGDLLDQSLSLAFVQRLRGEVAFPGVEQLKRQIGQDCEAARRVLGLR